MLGTEPIGKLLIKYSLPAIVGMMVNGLYNVIDRMFIGNIPGVGPLAITGLGITMPIMTIIIAFGSLIGVGTATNVSIKLGEGKKEEAQKLIGNAITLGVIVGIIITILGLVFQDQILTMFGASSESLQYAKAYINIILWGSLFSILGMTLNPLIRGDGNPKLSATIMIIGCVTNIILDAVFIFGLKMGIQGAALATVISQFITTVLGLLYFLGGKSNLKLKFENLKLDLKLTSKILSIGSAPFAMQIAASCVQIICNNALRAHGGDLAIGAMATINSIIMLIGLPIVGLSQGAQPIIGYNYGSKQYDRADKTLKICMKIAVLGLLVGWTVIQLFPEQMVSVFNSDPELVKISSDGIRKYIFLIPLSGVSMIGANYIQSIGKAKVAMFLSLLRQVILLVPLMLVMPGFFGLDGVWFAQPIADGIAFIITLTFVSREIKSHKKELHKECAA